MNKLSLALLLLLPGLAFAQEKKPFRWGTDPTGGAPFIYQDANGKYIGFEVEFAEYLAGKLGRKSEMIEGDWANLPEQLRKPADIEKGVDVILNGYELRKDFAEQFGVTRPYYLYRLTLMARKADATIRNWDDLRNGKSVGVLGGTAAHQYLLKRFGETIDLKTNPDVANVIKLVNDNRMDATLQDGPCATHFFKEYPELHAVAESEKPGFYVVYFRKDDKELGAALDRAIADAVSDGTLERIYRKYGLWNADQAELAGWQSKPWPPPFEEEAVSTWPRLIRELIRAAGMTVFLSLTSFPLAMLLGMWVAVGRVYGPWYIRVPLGIYVEVLRGTPLLLQLFVIYYVVPDIFRNLGVPQVGQWLTPIVAGILGLAINYSAYEAENYRAGLLVVPKGQIEAAEALGWSRYRAIRHVVVPQAVRIVIPPVTNDFVALFKDTSACSILFVTELTRKYNELFNFNRSYVIELAFITAGLYLLMSYPLSLLAGYLERRLSGEKGGRA